MCECNCVLVILLECMVDCLWLGWIVTKIGHSAVVVSMYCSSSCILCGQEDFSSEEMMTIACWFFGGTAFNCWPYPY